jgi:alanine racemase
MGERGDAQRRAWVEVSLGALRRNAEALVSRLGGAKLLPMVKADGYGLGASRVVTALRPLDPWGFGVATVEEGVALRTAGATERILVFSPCGPLDAASLLTAQLEPAVTSLDALQAYAEAARESTTPLRFHLEIDTGIGRAGLPWTTRDAWLPILSRTLSDAPRLTLASTFTHFHSAETNAAETRAQWERYQAVFSSLREAGLDPGVSHVANSAAVLRYPEYNAEVVRPGLFLYGGGGDKPAPESVMRLQARILDVRDVDAGWTVSYGGTWVAPRKSRLATLGLGYADGLPVAASNRGQAIVNGQRVPIRGRVCMDVTVVDATGLEQVVPGTTATLVGRDGPEEITLTELADTCGMIEYEILTGLGARLTRIAAVERLAQGGAHEPA